MKKIIGILGIIIIAMTMFFNSETMVAFNSDTSLASLIKFNSANAEGSGSEMYWVKTHRDCIITLTGEAGARFNVYGQIVILPESGTITISSNIGVDCDINGPSQCTVFDCNQIL